MSSLLIDEFVANCPNSDTILDSFLWPPDTWPDLERVEAAHMLLEALNARCREEENRNELLSTKVRALIWERCIPLLVQMSENASHKSESGAKIFNSLCRLLGSCLALLHDSKEVEKLTAITLSVFTSLEGDDGIHIKGQFDMDIAVEILAILLPLLPGDQDLLSKLTPCILSAVKVLSGDAQVSKILVRVLFTLLHCVDDRSRADILLRIWQDLCFWHQNENNAHAVTSRALLCLTAVSDYLFPPSETALRPTTTPHSTGLPDPRCSLSFWTVIQAGLTHRDNVARKRALYLLKKCVAQSEMENSDLGSPTSPDGEVCLFRWVPSKSKELQTFWQDYVLIMETLEENQIHVVRPVLNRINTLIEATVMEESGGGMVHACWLQCVYERLLQSENKAVMREGVHHLLDLQILNTTTFANTFSQFIVGPFMDVLSESSLYQRTANQLIGECPEVGLKLQTFMLNFFSSLSQERKGPVLLQLIKRLGSRHWCAVPLLFFSQALAALPVCPLLGPDGLLALREVLRCTMITHQVLLRGSAQCFLLHSALCQTDVQSVSLEEVFSFLIHFRPDESLSRGTALWNEVCEWFVKHESAFRPGVGSSDAGILLEGQLTSSLQRYAWHRLDAFLTVPASTEQTERLQDSGEAELLALTVLLCADVEERRQGEGKGEGGEEGAAQCTLERLLVGWLEVLRRLSTSLYLPLCKSDKSLQLLVHLLQLRRRRAAGTEANTDDAVSGAVRTLVLSVVESVQGYISRRLSGELQEVCDVERADLYLCVLRELMLEFGSVAWYRGNLEHSFLPALSATSLRILKEPSEQVPSVCGQVQRAVAMAVLSLVCEVTASETSLTHSQPPSSTYTPVPDTHTRHTPRHRFSLPLSPLREYFSLPQHLNQALLKPILTSSDEEVPLLRDWGRVAARYISDQWSCRGLLQRAVGPGPSVKAEGDKEVQGSRVALEAAVEALSLLPSDLVLPVLDYMALLLPHMVLQEEGVCVEAVRLSWRVVQALSGNAHDFWPALHAFIRLAFHRDILELGKDQAPALTSAIQQIVCELMELSEVRSGVFNVLIGHCCQTWMPSDLGSDRGDAIRGSDSGQGGGGDDDDDDERFSSAVSHLDILTRACLHGPVFRRDQRLIQEVQMYVEQLGEQCAANVAVTSDNRDEQFPRVCVLAFLSHLKPTNQKHRQLMEELALRLIEKDRAIARSKTRYYSNSLQHRIRNRVWQSLLVLLPKLHREFVVGTLLAYACEAGFSSNQASVKYLIEWSLLLILHTHPTHTHTFWDCFDGEHEKTKTSICTFLSVLVHMETLLPRLEDKLCQWRRALEVSLQWCFSHNFSVRLYALLALKRVWGLEGLREEARRRGPGQEEEGATDPLGGLATVIQACLAQAETAQNTGNALRNWSRIQEHFFFSVFHPIKDYSLETIFYSFPRLSDLADDEWIPVWKFSKMAALPMDSSPPLSNPTPQLSRMQPGDWVQQDRGEQEQEERWSEVQKKVTAWRLSFLEEEPHMAAQQRALRLGKHTASALLVVASLIDKPTNLGGLCRTCEIFGASGLVLDSLRHVSDKQFQALSVSSELWLPIMEVRPGELSSFLQLKKAEGYSIVGVEQTANSHKLQDYTFPQKTLLLLGNEREGIPAPLLQLLDVCVEIPQEGVTRSLNVHVSAALLVWEYTRQHLHSSTTQAVAQ
ncbi:probable methyltransferase TARBP1 [Engraulis encrasicolus]|uniref:probable methyltransferase TARBP1 n=1 Tax=Engraulis encrasicolus TaxID=184585 RepID=UPI002FD6C3E5